MQRRDRHSINPIYLSPGFQAYRKKQDENLDKKGQKWPDILEDAFLDGEFPGRHNFDQHGSASHGWNQLYY
jgi:hypothetical protein